MNYYIMTLFPEMFPGIMDASILGRGGEKGLIRWETFNIRDYTLDKHSKVDDYPYGGGAGMVMQAEVAGEEELVFLCGHYEGIDERVLEEIVTDPVSLGDYVLTGGELPAMVMMDTISRLVPGVLGNGDSADTESFSDGLLEYPQYTRPAEILGRKVPEVLLSGHHEKIEAWRREKSLERTRQYRPDLYQRWKEKQE